MSNARNDKRLDRIESQLTPKDWAIKLANEIRLYPNNPAFLRAIAKGTYRESPYIKPFFALAQQAEDRHPGEKQENVRARQVFSQNLRMEYQALKSMINSINEVIRVQAQMNRLMIRALAVQLHGLILQDAFAQTAGRTATWVERWAADTPDEKERQLILKELADVALASGPPTHLASLARDWADDAAMILMENVARKQAVQAVQDEYFDGHAILSHDIEGALEKTIEMIIESIATFNEYLSTKGNGLRPELSQQGPKDENSPVVATGPLTSSLTVDVESIRGRTKGIVTDYIYTEWVSEAKHGAVAEVLRETGGHENVVWERFCEKFGAESSMQ
jgi:hypothetical protein